MYRSEILHNILPLVRKPARYAGGELHAATGKWEEADVRFALVFPDLYEVGMSHFGLQILYRRLNSRPGFLAERCYAPDLDMEQELRRHGFPLFSIESRRPLTDFDVIGITLPYELCYTNVLTILDLAGLPLWAAHRNRRAPLVLGGGSCSMNPEPVADFFDAIVLGDGEDVIMEVADTVSRAKREKMDRPEMLAELAVIHGVYVPSFFSPRYTGPVLREIVPLRSGCPTVRRRVLARLPKAEEVGRTLVPVVKPIHDRLAVEIARGCTRGCRFCQAGIIYRPVRERPVEDIVAAAEKGIAASGYEELALLSLSSGDYSCLPELMSRLMDRYADQYVSISMPSMRVGTLTPEIMHQIRRVRKTGFTVAPEAGTDRLRQVLNKGISETDLLHTCRNAFAMGWGLIKLYFMIGLPTETWEDVEAIVALARLARKEAGAQAKRVQINVSVGTFVPKPHTPFQWERQLSLYESQERIDHLKRLLPRRGFRLKWHDPRQSLLEGVFSRGDRRLSGLIEQAWKSGVRLDGWSEHYRLEHWQDAARHRGIDLNFYLRPRDPQEPLPWDHLDSGVTREFFLQERERAMRREYTPDCRTAGCQQCGLCDFKIIRPVICRGIKDQEGDVRQTSAAAVETIRPEHARGVRFRVHYTRLGDSRFFSHLELLQLIFRALRRARVPVLYSLGHNPTPRVSFSAALPVGMESEAEYFDMEASAALKDRRSLAADLDRELPPGMRIIGIEPSPAREPEVFLTSYEVVAASPLPETTQERIADFLARDSFPICRIRKNKEQEIDVRPLVRSLCMDAQKVRFELISRQGCAGVSPREILLEILGMPEKEALLARIRKRKRREFGANT